MLARLRFTAAIGLLVALGEIVATLSLRGTELELLLIEGVLAFAAGTLLFLVPLSQRWLTVLPVVLAGLFHGGRVLTERIGPLSTIDWAILGAHVVGVPWVLSRWIGKRPPSDELVKVRAWTRRTLMVFGATYVTQALWCARLVVPITLGTWSLKAPAVFLSATLAPLVAAMMLVRLSGSEPGAAQARSLRGGAAAAPGPAGVPPLAAPVGARTLSSRPRPGSRPRVRT